MENTKTLQNLTISDWHQEVNPNRIVITASNGRKLTVAPQHSYRDKSYQLWLRMLDAYDTNPKAKAHLDKAITNMQ